MVQHPDEYCCLACNVKLSEHETLIELEYARSSRGAQIGINYCPFADRPEFREQLLDRIK